MEYYMNITTNYRWTSRFIWTWDICHRTNSRMTLSANHRFFFTEQEWREECNGLANVPSQALPPLLLPFLRKRGTGIASTYASVHQHPSVNTAYNAWNTQRGRDASSLVVDACIGHMPRACLVPPATTAEKKPWRS